MKTKKLKNIFIIFAIAMAIAFMPTETQAASKPKLSTTKVTLKVGKTKKDKSQKQRKQKS